MDFEALARAIWNQIVTAWNNPVPVIACILVAWFIIRRMTKREYEVPLANMKSLVELKEAQVQDYKDKLSGATPEEAQERVARLEEQVRALTHQRHLSDEQKSALADAARSIPLGTCRLYIVFHPSFPEAAIFAEEIAQALRDGGWQVEAEQTVRPGRLGKFGLNFAIPSLEDRRPEILAFGSGLDRAGLSFKWVEEPSFEWDAVLYVDRAEA